MKIAISNITSTPKLQENKKNKPSFKSAGGALSLVGNVMQGIESKGYFLSFLIQDGLGMTVPRSITGFNRDKDITGKYNIQEGTEVALREGLTGPFIIAVAPAVLWLTTKFCRSTNTNTNLIKRFGKNLKEFVKDSRFDKSVKENSEKFKKEFARFNIEKIYKNSVPKDLKPEETINLIFAEFEKLGSKDKKVKAEAFEKINSILNEKILETSPELYDLNRLAVGEGQNKKLFNTKDVMKALNDFCDDAIINNKDFANINEEAAENIKNNFATKRLLTNIANVVLTLGGLSVIPKLYARSDVAPSAKVLQHMQEKKEVEENSSGEVSFKGKGINSNNIFSKIGRFLTHNIPEKFSELVEYTGYNFTRTTFAALSIFGLLLPRGKRAWDRAQIDENGKRDMTEINEILLRDTVSSLSVVFAVPILTKIFVNAYESGSGFVLTNKASEGKNFFRKALDVINPYSALDVLSIADLDTIYGNVDSKSKLINFANFIDKKGGDLEKILSKSEFANEMFNDKTFTLNSIKKLSKKQKNKRIIELFKNFDVADINAKNETISKLMKGSENIKKNRIAQFARGLNSIPGAISTFIISPVLLGVLIPMLTYHNTRKAQEKAAQSRQENKI